MVWACNENGKWKTTNNGARQPSIRGRPTKAWMDNIMKDIKAQGMDMREATDKARQETSVQGVIVSERLTEEKTGAGTGLKFCFPLSSFPL